MINGSTQTIGRSEKSFFNAETQSTRRNAKGRNIEVLSVSLRFLRVFVLKFRPWRFVASFTSGSTRRGAARSLTPPDDGYESVRERASGC